VINRTTLAGLAAVTFVLFIANAAMGQEFGEGNAFLWTLGDIVWIGFVLCALALVGLTVGVLARSLVRSRRSRTNAGLAEGRREA
jgi:hypothetical protein